MDWKAALQLEGIASTEAAENADTGFGCALQPSPAARQRSRLRIVGVTTDQLSQLMERYARGDDEVFERLYTHLAPRLHGFCRRLTMNEVEADDCFQETFLKLHRARATYVCGSNVLHWAFAIARSVYITRLRYRRRRPEEVGRSVDVGEREDLHTDHATTPEAQVMAQHLVELAATTLGRMSEKNRVAYTLLKEEGISAKEAAALLGTTPDVIKQRAHRAYEQIRTALDASY
jgi:RNA polymerase sigma-70 factor (ECF subfamily)